MKRWMLYGGVAIAIWIWSHTQGRTNVIPEGGLTHPGYQITALEPYAIEARVLGRHDYRNDREAAIAPTDLALGWGPMADDAVLDAVEISQDHRWYFWHATTLPIPAREITLHSANVHVIAASPEAAQALAHVRANDRVRITGQLVDVRGEDGWHWRSSLSRSDTGARSCELVWLERLEIL